MPPENVEIVRRIFEAVARRDSAAVLGLYDPEVVWDHTRGPAREVMGEPCVYRGHEGLRRWSREWYEAWEDVQADVVEVVEVGEHVVSVLNYRGRGRASGVQVEMAQMAGAWTIRDGKVVRVLWFRTRGEALEAASREGSA